MEYKNKKLIYMDYGATTFVKHEVADEMKPFVEEYFGNPSSLYFISRKSKQAIDIAREKTACAINADADEIYFTGGGSESDNWAIKGIALANMNNGNHIITTNIEHHAVLNSCKFLEKHGFRITYLPVDKYGMVSIEDLKRCITDKTILVSIMFANNEIGTIQPIKEIGTLCREKNVIFHTDAVQAVGHIPVDVKDMNIDLLSLAAHKFYGPKGIGALYVKKGIKIDNLIHGGSQERARRAGTENVAGIVGLGKAIEISEKNIYNEIDRLTYLRDKFIKQLSMMPDFRLNGAEGHNRLAGNVNVSFKGVDNETLLMLLDEEGICASAGSACSAGALEPSHVLKAIGLKDDEAKGSVRFTLGETTDEDEINIVSQVVKRNIEKIKY